LSTAGRLAASYARELQKLLAAIKARRLRDDRNASANRMVMPLVGDFIIHLLKYHRDDM